MIRLLLVPMRSTQMLSQDRQELIDSIGIQNVAEAEVVVVYNEKEYRCIKDKITGGDTSMLFKTNRLHEWIEVLNNEVNK